MTEMLIAAVTQLQASVTNLTGQMATIAAHTASINKMLTEHVAWEEEQKRQYDNLKEVVAHHSRLIKAIGTVAAVLGAAVGWAVDKAFVWMKHT